MYLQHTCVLFSILAFVDSTLDNENEMLDIAFVTDMADQKEAVDSVDESL